MNKDLIDKLLARVAHNRYTVLACAIVLALVAVSCSALAIKKPAPPALARDWMNNTTPLVAPPLRVSTEEYDRRVLALDLEFQIAFTDLTNRVSRLVNIRNQASAIIEHDSKTYDERLATLDSIVTTVSGLVTTGITGGLNPTGLITASLGISGLLFGYSRHKDARRKDEIITGLKSTSVQPPTI